MRRLLPLVLVAVTALVACGSATPAGSDDNAPSVPTATTEPGGTVATPATPPTAPSTADSEPGTIEPKEVNLDALVDRRWVVEARVTIVGPQPVPSTSTAALTIAADGSLTVDTGCNRGSATVTLGDDGTFTVGPLLTRKMACIDPDLAAVESSLLATLSGTVVWSVIGDRLSLTPTMMSDTGLELRAGDSSGTSVPGPGVAVPDALVGPTWILESFITVGPIDDVPAGVVASLRFAADGTLEVQTGCNSGTAHVRFRDLGSFAVGDLTLTEIACDGDAGAVQARVLAQLGHELHWSLDGDVLALYPADVTDTGLTLRAA